MLSAGPVVKGIILTNQKGYKTPNYVWLMSFFKHVKPQKVLAVFDCPF